MCWNAPARLPHEDEEHRNRSQGKKDESSNKELTCLPRRCFLQTVREVRRRKVAEDGVGSCKDLVRQRFGYLLLNFWI